MSKINIFGLGGLNENGKNMYVVKVNKDIFVFDAGLKYDNDLNKTLEEIAKMMGISRSYVSRIESKALLKLSREIQE